MGPLVVVEVGSHAELHVLEGFLILLGLRPHHGVLAEHDGSLDRAGFHILRQAVELHGALLVGVGPDREVRTVHAQVVELRQQVGAAGEVEGHLPLVEAQRFVRNGAAARDVDAAGQRQQQGDGAVVVDAVGVVRERRSALVHDRAGAFSQQLHSSLELVHRDLADLSGLFERELLDVLLVLLKAMAPLLDKLLVVVAGLDDRIAEAQRQRAVGARTDLQVHVSDALRGRGQTRIDDDELAAAFLVGEQALPAGRAGPRRVVAPDDAAAGLAGDGVGTGGKGLRGEPLRAVDQLLRQLSRLVAGGGLGAHVRGAEGEGQALHGRAGLLRVAGGEEDLLGAVLFLDAVELLGDGSQRLIPGDLLPNARLALRVGALHRVEQAGRIIHFLNGRNALGADVDVRVVVAALDTDNLVVLDDALHAAARAMVALHAVGILDLFRRSALSQSRVRIDIIVDVDRRGGNAGGGRKLEEFASCHFHSGSPSLRLALGLLDRSLDLGLFRHVLRIDNPDAGAFNLLGIILGDILGDFALRILDVAEDAAAGRAVLGTHRLFAVLDAADAEGALLGQVQRTLLGGFSLIGQHHAVVAVHVVLDEGTRAVRAGGNARAAANALVVIGQDNALFSGVDGADRAGRLARCVFAVHAHGQLVANVRVRIVAPLYALNAIVVNARARAVGHLAGHHARVAAGAVVHVQNHSILCHGNFLPCSRREAVAPPGHIQL